MTTVSAAQRDLYRNEGYMILPGVIPAGMLTMLREECSYYLGYYDSMMDAKGVQTEGISHRGKRYFINNRYRLSSRLWEFVFSPLMAEVAQAALGPDVFLFHEQWVVKGAEQGMKFSWHQDSGYVKWYDPKDRIINHTQEQGTNDLIGYTGPDPGDPMIVPAGSIVAFTSYNFHRSGPNKTDRMRRIYLPQYSSAPIHRPDGKPWAMATPFIQGGKVVYNRADDTAEKYGPFPEKKSPS
jgi:hypothetical protein